MKPSKYMREDNAYEKDIEKPISKRPYRGFDVGHDLQLLPFRDAGCG